MASKNNIEALKKRKERLSQRAARETTKAPSIARPSVEASDDGLFYQGVEEANLTAEQEAAEQINRIRGGGGADIENKEQRRRYIDQQDDAHRVSFDDSQRGSVVAGRVGSSGIEPNVPSSGLTRKRAFDDGFEPTQDESFQSDQRVHAAPSRAPQAMMGSAGGHVRNVLPRTSLAYDVSQVDMPSQYTRQNPGQAIEALPTPATGADGLPTMTQQQRYRQANHMARIASASYSASQAKTARARRKWSAAEEQRLMDLIAEYGPIYAHIKKVDDNQDQVFGDRNGEDLRFKARNMKLDFLK